MARYQNRQLPIKAGRLKLL